MISCYSKQRSTLIVHIDGHLLRSFVVSFPLRRVLQYEEVSAILST